ncbi:hypothetical protein LTR28_003466 [Elasticomyces elasticus]|nr:hypothetical protein LTR28_003466 [Elasticomyces elasticus]
MESLTSKTLVTKPYDLTYGYYLSPNFHQLIQDATSNKKSPPVLMLIHGFPDCAEMWAGALPYLLTLGYPLILPDLLGFGASSKPTEPKLYNYRQQADSLAQILDREGVAKEASVIPIGHDWGSATAQRFYLYHRERCVGLTLLSLAYQIPSPEPFDLKKVNAATEKRFGYPQWEYWNFFTAPDAPEQMKNNLARFWEVNNGYRPSPDPKENGHDVWMREMFCTPGTMGEYITGTGRYKDVTIPLRYYPKGEEVRGRFLERLGKDGLEGPVNYYYTLRDNTMLEEERALCPETSEDGKDRRKIEVPVLYIGQTGDWVCRVDLMGDAVQKGLVSDLEEKVVQGGHWILYEKPDEIASIIGEWVQKRFPVSA